MTPEELYKQQTAIPKVQLQHTEKKPFNPNLPPPKIPDNTDFTTGEKMEILAKGQIYMTWVMTLLFSAVLILIAIQYTFPLNIAILGFAVIMDAIALWLTRKYMMK